MDNALVELINANVPLYQNEIENLSDTQLNFLKAVVCSEIQFTSTVVMQKYHLGTPHNVMKNKKILIAKDLINIQNGVYEFLDPVFEMWFKKNIY